MNDKELLELAAKAAGMTGFVGEDWNGLYFCVPGDRPVIWKPLADDGDALRLAVKLGLLIDPQVPGVVQFEDQDPGVFTCVISGSRKATEGNRYHALHESDPYAATRRAIVRAAAALFAPGSTVTKP